MDKLEKLDLQSVIPAPDEYEPASKKRKGAVDQSILGEIEESFKEAETAEASNRELALECIRFARLSRQWPDDVMKQRKTEERPMLTINKLPAFIRQVVNEARMNKPSIKVRPVDSKGDPKTAEKMAGLIRNIEYMSDADTAYDTAGEQAVVGGFGYFRIVLEYAHDDSFDLDIKIKRIRNQFTVYRDPRSQEADSSDWNCCHITSLIKKESFKQRWKSKDAKDWNANYDNLDAIWRVGDDLRMMEYWKRQEVEAEMLKLIHPQLGEQLMMEAQYMERMGMLQGMGWQVVGNRPVRHYSVCQYLATGGEVLEKNEWPGTSIPVIPVNGDEVDEEGKLHLRGMIVDAMDPQRMFNYWRTTSTEMVALGPKAPWVGPKGAFSHDKTKWMTANKETHGFLEYTIKPNEAPPVRMPFDAMPAGALQESLNASDDIKSTIGMYDASLGARSNEISGAAITARQREGDVSTFHFTDNMNRAIRDCGRKLIDLIPKVYTGKRMIRILGIDGVAENVPLGQPVKQPDGTEIVFDLTVGKYDLVVEAGPSFASRRVEATTHMLEMMRSNPAIAPLIGDIFAKNLDWPGSEEIAKRLEANLPQHLQGDNPLASQLKIQLKQATEAIQHFQGLNADLQKQIADKANETKVKGYDAETKRIATVADVSQNQGQMLDPAGIQALVFQTLQSVLQFPELSAAAGMQMPMPGMPPPGGMQPPPQLPPPGGMPPPGMMPPAGGLPPQ